MKNVFIMIMSLAVLVFVGDQLKTKYNLDPNEPTCINTDVQALLLNVVTEDVKKEFLELGFVIDARVEKDNTTTEKRDITYRGHSLYQCNTTVEVTVQAVKDNTMTQKVVKKLSNDDLHLSKDINYKVNPNDLGTTYFVRANRLSIDLFSNRIFETLREVQEVEKKCINFKQDIENKEEKRIENKNLDDLYTLIKMYDIHQEKCIDTESTIAKTEYLKKIESLNKDIIQFKKDIETAQNINKPEKNKNVNINLNDEVSVTYNAFDNPDGGMNTGSEIYTVSQNGKECKYEYSVGVASGIITDKCSGKEYTFNVKDEDFKFIPYEIRPYLDPYFYMSAYTLMTNKQSTEGSTVISKQNSKGIKIYCLKDKSICKTEKEVLNYILNK